MAQSFYTRFLSVKNLSGDSRNFQLRVKSRKESSYQILEAALTADRIASSAEFFSFGTNDLTQMTFGSRNKKGPNRTPKRKNRD